MIRKTKHGYQVIGHKSGKSFGTYSSRTKAEQRLRQVKRFGRLKANKLSLALGLLTTTIWMMFGVFASVLITPTQNPSGVTPNASVIIQYNISTDLMKSANFTFGNTSFDIMDGCVWASNFDNRSSLRENDTQAYDYCGNTNSTIVNGAGIYWNSNGKYGGSFAGRGTSDISYLNSSTFLFNNLTFSISFWIVNYGDAASDYGHYFRIVNVFSGNGIISPYRYKTGLMGMNIQNSTMSADDFTYGSNFVTNNVWKNIIITYNGTDMKSYENGNYLYTATGTAKRTGQLNASIVYIQILGKSSGNMINGSMDDLIIFNRTLSDNEIKMLYNSQITKYDTQNWSFQNNATPTATAKSYQLCSSNSTQQICSVQSSIRRISTITSNFGSQIGNIRSDFYGANTHWNGLSEGATDYIWHRGAWNNASMKVTRSDMSLDSYYSGLYNLDLEEWSNTTQKYFTGGSYNTGCDGYGGQAFFSPNISISRLSSGCISGNYCLNITNLNTSGTNYGTLNYFVNGINFTDGNIYNVTFYVKGNYTGVAYFYDAINLTRFGSKDYSANDTWKAITFGANLTSPHNYIIILAEAIYGNMSVIVDNLSITNNGQPFDVPFWRSSKPSSIISYINYSVGIGNKIILITDYMPRFLANVSSPYCNYQLDAGYSSCPAKDYDILGQISTDMYTQVTNNGQWNSSVDNEVWNEPELGTLLNNLSTDGLNKSIEYAKIFNATYIYMKSKYPNVTIGAWGGSSVNNKNMFTTILTNLTNTTAYPNVNVDFWSFHRYTDTPSNYLLDLNNFYSNCTQYAGAKCNDVRIDEFNVASAIYKNTSSYINYYGMDMASIYSYVLNSYPANASMILYEWTENAKYGQGTSEYPQNWLMVSSPTYDNVLAPSYLVTQQFAKTYCPAGGTVYSSSSDDSTLKTVSCQTKEGKRNLIVINTDTVSKNVSVNLGSVAGNTSLQDSTGTKYRIDSGVSQLGILDSYGILYLSENTCPVNYYLDTDGVTCITTPLRTSTSTENILLKLVMLMIAFLVLGIAIALVYRYITNLDVAQIEVYDMIKMGVTLIIVIALASALFDFIWGMIG